MSTLSVRWADNHLKEYADKLAELERRFPKVLPRVINQVGNRAKTQVIRNLTKQTGLRRDVIVRAVNVTPAGGRRLAYDMTTRGGNIRLKYLKPRETRAGVTASPWGKRTLFPGTFIYGGQFPNRHGLVRDGHVMRRIGGRKLTFARSGMFIPTEMTSGATAAAFEQTAAPLLKQRVEAVIKKLVP